MPALWTGDSGLHLHSSITVTELLIYRHRFVSIDTSQPLFVGKAKSLLDAASITANPA
jgi:hypothetical protein